jgi:hypothetical protein
MMVINKGQRISLPPNGSHHTTSAFLPVPLKTALEKTFKSVLCLAANALIKHLQKNKTNVRVLSTRL